MLVRIQGWRVNRSEKRGLILLALMAGLLIFAVFSGMIIAQIFIGVELTTLRLERLVISFLGMTLAALFLMIWPVVSLKTVYVQIPYHRVASRTVVRSIRASSSDKDSGMFAVSGQMSGQLPISLPDRPPAGTASGDILEERMAELAALHERFESKEALCRQLLGKILTAQEEERTRLARELHDTIGQSLTAIIMTTAAVEKNLPPGFPSGKEQLARVRAVARQALQDLRNLIFDLRPDMLDDLGLTLAVRNHAKKYLEATGIQVRFRMAIKDELSPEIEITVFRVVQEAITNIFRHARATEAYISLTKKNGRLIVRIEDNGIGFDQVQVMNGQRHTWGLHGMKERINLLGGKFYIGSRPGSGTLVLAEVPLDQK